PPRIFGEASMRHIRRLLAVTACASALAACAGLTEFAPSFGGRESPAAPAPAPAVAAAPAEGAQRWALRGRDDPAQPAPDFRRLLAVTACASALAACAGLTEFAPSFGGRESPAAPAPAPAVAAAPAEGAQRWAQSVSDVPADPAPIFGVLPNGMRYAVMRNATPPGQASLRLHIAAGSLMEEEDQRGLAHFIEHMAFNGTTSVPEGQLLPILERLGLAFGPDTNAFTSFDQTVYQLDLPNTATDTVATGLMIMREMAGEAVLDAEAIERERGIVISEERTRATPGYRVAQARYDFLMRDQLLPRRFPIGDVDILRTAPRERFVAFYDAWYRPERATLVAVGDFDPAEMEARIRADFSDWTNPTPPAAEPELGPVA